jgi:hypothetical protein
LASDRNVPICYLRTGHGFIVVNREIRQLARIELTKNLSEGDLAFSEQCLGLSRSNFKDFLRMGKVY